MIDIGCHNHGEVKVTMTNIDRLQDFIDRGQLIQGKWGDLSETACMISALAGATSDDECAAKGWPMWLAELGRTLFDNWSKEDCYNNALRFGHAVKHYSDTSGDWDRAFRDIRVKSVLPIALEAIGEGNQDWRVRCINAIQWSIDHDGEANSDSVWIPAAGDAGWVAKGKFAAGAFAAANAAKDAVSVGVASWAAVDARNAAASKAYERITADLFEILERA